ncbi:ASF1 like histone chaperone-domain-containing protein [Polychytrium aggregatum]|uniref:ASF1 like histone chaperone-domain-containing protein n=1 Tax=Polychytrium aggregatum TaxID=110093 RepID=UPI0022FEAEB7|nr:ASF1 like histone chaperone-domain-containing protein [Polychytrium aggregatum]KAI9197427.1 ASF1 like histone chaperone-domain-containing protein [Polychytrium aggregatum]
MALVMVTNISLSSDHASFLTPFQFEITIDVVEPLPHDIDFTLYYISSAYAKQYDQELESISVGPVPMGTSKFVLTAPPPNPGLIPNEEVLDVAVLLLACAYQGQEFASIGYYISNGYDDEQLALNPPAVPEYTRIQRRILVDKPKVTRRQIQWHPTEADSQMQQFELEDARVNQGVDLMPEANFGGFVGHANAAGLGGGLEDERSCDDEDDDEDANEIEQDEEDLDDESDEDDEDEEEEGDEGAPGDSFDAEVDMMEE